MARPDKPDPREAAVAIARRLRDAGHEAYLAGGCVRDELLGLVPEDYDVATDATPERVASLFRTAALVGAHFGVMIVRDRGVVTEVATFRAEGPYSDHRRPDHVEFADARTDAQRRDFTINALFLDPLAPPEADGIRGRIIDFVGGVADLRARVLRAVGDPDCRLNEDHLRALRAVRLAARLALKIEPETADAIARHAAALKGVSRERIGDEIRRMMTHPSRATAADLLSQLSLEQAVVGSRSAPSRSLLSRAPPDATFPMALAAWALDRHRHPDPDTTAREFRQRLCLSNDEHRDLRDLLALLRTLEHDWATLTRAQRKRTAATRSFPAALLLMGLLDPATAGARQQEVERLASEPGGLAPDPLLTGDDLVAAGHKPGPAFGRVLEGVYDAQLEGRVTTKEAALELARRLGV